MSHKQKLVTICDKRELAFLYSQKNIRGKHFEVSTGVQDEVTVVEELDLIARINQDGGGKLQKIVEGEDEGYAGTNL